MKKIFSLMLLCAVVMFASCSKDDDGKGSNDESVKVTGVTLDQPTLALKVGETKKLIATIAPENATDKTVTWKSSATSIAEVTADGTVTAVAVGTATITVKTTEGGKEATCKVTVTKVPSLNSFENEDMVDGSSWANAYEIASKEQLGLLATRISGNSSNQWDTKYYKLTVDIDFGDTNTDIWTPIGTRDYLFKGHFDGGNHTVKGKLISAALSSNAYFGIFGYVYQAEIKNLTFAGSLDVSAITDATSSVGGIAGYVSETQMINCSNVSDLTAKGSGVGGIVGSAKFNNKIIACINKGNISNTITGASSSAGGIVGGNLSLSSLIIGCINIVNNISCSSDYAGGIIGLGQATASWSKATINAKCKGGVLGRVNGTANNCYWKEISGLDGAGSGTITNGASFTGDHPTADQIAAMNAAWAEAQPTGREYQFNATTGEIEKITQ